MYPHESSNGEERVDWRAQQQRQNRSTFHNSTGQFAVADEHETGFQTEPTAGSPIAAFRQSMVGARRADLEYNNDDDEGLLYIDDDTTGVISSSNSSPPPNRYNNNDNNDGSSGGSSSNHASPSTRPIGRSRTASRNPRTPRRPRLSVPNLVASMSMGQPESIGISNSMDTDSYSHSSGQRQQSQHQQSQHSQDGADFLSAPYQDLMSEQQALQEQHQALQRATNRRPPKRTPLPKAGLPMEPIIPVVEPTLPTAKLSKRGTPKRKVRLADLQVGVTPKQPQTKNGGQQEVQAVYVIDCAGCGCQLQIKKGTILVQCHACQQVHPTATCRVHAS
jgi:hypothetical protein